MKEDSEEWHDRTIGGGAGSDTWHFCTNCTNWPTSDYDTATSKPTTGEFCNQCMDKEKNKNCS